MNWWSCSLKHERRRPMRSGPRILSTARDDVFTGDLIYLKGSECLRYLENTSIACLLHQGLS
jgi:hypothetical protein